MRTIISGLALALVGAPAIAETPPFFTIVAPEVSVYSATSAGGNGASRKIINGTFDPFYTYDIGSGGSVSAGPLGEGVTSASLQILAGGTLPGGQPVTAEYAGSVDARTGRMRASATHSGASSLLGGQFSVSEVVLADTVFFTNATDADALLTVFLRVDGAILNSSGTGSDDVLSELLMSSCAACSEVDGIRYAATGAGVGSYLQVLQEGSGITSMTDYFSPLGPMWEFTTFGGHGGSSFDWLMEVDLLIPRGGSSLGLRFRLATDCRFGAACLFGNTQGIGFGPLPDGLSFTSASGFFLRPLGGGVIPEPATWAMLISGFGLVGATARRRRAAAPTAG